MECEKNRFSDPKFYSEIFQDYLGNGEKKRIYDGNWLAVLSCFSQTMRTEIGSCFSEEIVEEIDDFISFSLRDEVKRSYLLSSNDVGRSKDFLEKIIPVLEEL